MGEKFPDLDNGELAGRKLRGAGADQLYASGAMSVNPDKLNALLPDGSPNSAEVHAAQFDAQFGAVTDAAPEKIDMDFSVYTNETPRAAEPVSKSTYSAATPDSLNIDIELPATIKSADVIQLEEEIKKRLAAGDGAGAVRANEEKKRLIQEEERRAA
jgi:hypothetical protein